MSRTKQSARRGKAKRPEGEGPGAEPTAKKAKKGAAASVSAASMTMTSTTTPSDAARHRLSLLLGGMSLDKFLDEYFEKQPLIVRCKEASSELFPSNLFSKQTLLNLAGQHELEHGKDMTVCRYVGEERDNYEPPNGNPIAKKKSLSGLFDKRYSCQFYQPQRYVDGLCELNAAFEDVFGCLAGASAYLTPPAAQALAPHHDDVEVFILQTEGRKKWKLYHPRVELAGEHSSDLAANEIGDVWKEFTLEEGDMLYFPRGVIHQACTDEAQFSTHVTISVYQHQSWANFLEVALPRVIRRAFDSDVAFRRGLPVRYLSYMGSQFDTDAPDAKAFVQSCQELVRQLGTWVEATDLHTAADEAAMDYIANRLPPPPATDAPTAEFLLEAKSLVAFRDRSHIRLVIGEDEFETPAVTVFHSMRNCRVHHMGACTCQLDGADDEEDEEDEGESGGNDDEDSDNDVEGRGIADMELPPQPHSIVFPANLLQPLMKLYSAFPAPVSVSDLVTLGDDETEVRGMLLRLWSEGLLECSK